MSHGLSRIRQKARAQKSKESSLVTDPNVILSVYHMCMSIIWFLPGRMEYPRPLSSRDVKSTLWIFYSTQRLITYKGGGRALKIFSVSPSLNTLCTGDICA